MLNIFNKTQGKAGLVGLYATPEKLTLAHISRTAAGPDLQLCLETDAAGSEGRASALEKIVEENNLQGLPACFVLNPIDYKLLLVEAPKVEANEMAGAVKWKIKDLVGHPIEEMAITVFDVPESAYRSQANMVYAVAARKTRIQEIIGLVHGAGLELQAIDIPELAMMNLIEEGFDDEEGIAFLDLREDGTTLNLCRGGYIYLTRQLSTRLDSHVIHTHEWVTVRERLALEIQRSLDYYQSQMGQPMVSKIVLTPRAENAEMLAQELGMDLSIPVENMYLSSFLQTEQAIPMALQQACILSVAASLRVEGGQPRKKIKAKAA